MDSDALYREVTEKHGAALGRLAAGYERDAARRSALVREIHASIWKSLVFFDQRTALSTWVYRVAHNVGAAHLIEREGVGFESRHEPVEPGPLVPRALALLHELPALERQVIALYLEGLDVLVISDITGLPPSDVALRLHQTKTTLTHRVSPAPDEPGLPDRWRQARGQLPTAFTIAELRDRGLEGTARATKEFLEKRLLERRSERRFRLAGSLALSPVGLLLQPAALHSRAALIGVLALIGLVMVALVREWLAVSATTRALVALRPPGDSRLSEERATVFGLLLIATFVVIMVAAYKFSGGPRAHEVRSKQAVENTLTRCLDPEEAMSPECISVLRERGSGPTAVPSQAAGCRQKWTAFAAREPAVPEVKEEANVESLGESDKNADALFYLREQSARSAKPKSDEELYFEEVRREDEAVQRAKRNSASALLRQQRSEARAFSQSLLFDGESLAEECPGDLMLPEAVLEKDLVNDLIESVRSACLNEANSAKAADALAVCGAYARFACQGQSDEWRTRNEAFLTFMSVRERLSTQAQVPWECVDSPLVGVLQALSVSTPKGVSLTSFDSHDGAAKLTGSAPGPLEVTELARRLGDIVRTPSGLGRVVHRSADGSAGVKLLGRLDEMELAASEMKTLFSHGQMIALTEVRGVDGGTPSFDFVLTIALNRDALPSGKEWVARYVPDVIAEHYVAVVREAPENAEAWLALGYAHKAQSKPNEAIVAFRKYLELRPETPTKKQLEDQIYFLGGQ